MSASYSYEFYQQHYLSRGIRQSSALLKAPGRAATSWSELSPEPPEAVGMAVAGHEEPLGRSVPQQVASLPSRPH